MYVDKGCVAVSTGRTTWCARLPPSCRIPPPPLRVSSREVFSFRALVQVGGERVLEGWPISLVLKDNALLCFESNITLDHYVVGFATRGCQPACFFFFGRARDVVRGRWGEGGRARGRWARGDGDVRVTYGFQRSVDRSREESRQTSVYRSDLVKRGAPASIMLPRTPNPSEVRCGLLKPGIHPS